jgi:(2R)-ethylmalonyl-CoA mutase
MQQVLAFETDLLEHGDLFEGSKVVESRTAELRAAAEAELDEILALGGAFEAIDEMKTRLVRSHVERTRRIDSGELQVVGVNCFTETAPSPLGGEESILKVDPAVEAELREDVARWRAERDSGAVTKAIDALRRAAESGDNVMPATIALAHAGGTTGEWSAALRDVFGEYRAPTGVAAAAGQRGSDMAELVTRVKAMAGGPPKLLVAKPGLDGHSNGAEQVAVAARDAGFEVVYQGIRLTPEQIAVAARDEDVDIIGISILSGSHLDLVPDVLRRLHDSGVDAPVVVGGIIPSEDQIALTQAGVAAVYTPKDYSLSRIVTEMADLVEKHRAQVHP